MSDAELAKRIAEGDLSSLHELLDRYYKPVFRYLWQASGSKEDAEDLASQTLLRAKDELKGFRGTGTLQGWLFRAAYRELLRHRRRQALARLVRPAPEAVRPYEDAVVITDALAKLPIDQRSAFLLIEIEGLSVEECSLALGVPAGTVKSRCFHARTKLRQILGATYGDRYAESAAE